MKNNTLGRKNLEISDLRKSLAQSNGTKTNGKTYWRSLDELAQTDEFRQLVSREFPEQAEELTDQTGRRNFLKLMGASLAFGGLSGCTIQPQEKIVPFVRAPEELIPGKPLFYASAMPLGGIGTGVLVESHMGRPTKLEGNPAHPSSLGGTNSITQASILNLYDPDRAQVVKNAGRIATWNSFMQAFTLKMEQHKADQGNGLYVLSGTVTSPTLGHQLATLKKELPKAHWHQYEPVNRDASRQGALLAFGEALNTYYDFTKAEVVLSLDANFMASGPGDVRYARDFAAGRRVRDGQQQMNRLYMVESTPSPTGSMADHRLALSTSQIEAFALAVAKGLGIRLENSGSAPYLDSAHWLAPLIKDLKKHGGASLVIAGAEQSPAVHALAHAMNQILGNTGHTVHHTAPLETESVDQSASIKALAEAMQAGQVETLVILGGDPAYDAPADLEFVQGLEQVGFRIHLSAYENATTNLCHWHIPASHYLETWSDIRGHDGTVSIIQPLIEPLYNTKSAHDILGAILGKAEPAYDTVKNYWEARLTQDFHAAWRTALHDGLIVGANLPKKTPALKKSLKIPLSTAPIIEEETLELQFRPDPLIWDGSFLNNGWLQETPAPLTKLTWDNAALVSPATAERLQLSNEQVVTLQLDGRSLRVPIWIVPGQAQNVITLHLGYGQQHAGRVGKGSGFNAYALRSSTAIWSSNKVALIASFDHYPLACTQDHYSMEDRHLVRHAHLEEYQHNPRFAQEMGHDPPASLTLYPDFKSNGSAWGMSIDLNTCMGCNACSVACQSENNIPIVGKAEVLEAKEMSWIRIDRYYTDLDDPQILHQPVPCMQCENAPCELVCPVGATTHSEEGLNEMTYNRCVGTRYCSNNCPYKVRRFNFLQYVDRDTPSLKLQRNPDVTVRSRGVMEKCTYCVQRINSARIEAKKARTPIADGAITTACEQACPTESIVFGDINDPKSRISKLKASPLNYGILTDLNTKPRTTYLASLKNPNPEIAES
jgi:MoCo/4Fe-4S cofactor protein with predicted Tat translocation signal